MATAAQIAANRRNALRSTGPRTAAGKARSSQNARKHGLDSRSHPPWTDDPEHIALLTASYRELFRPEDPTEETLLRRIALLQHRLSRIPALEAALLNSRPIHECARALEKLSRLEASLDRRFQRAFQVFDARRLWRKKVYSNEPNSQRDPKPTTPREINRFRPLRP